MPQNQFLSLIRSLSVSAASTLLLTSVLAAQQSLSYAKVGQSDESAPYSWRLGVLVSGGFSPDYQLRGLLQYQEELLFFTTGVELGRRITSAHGHGPLRGHGEAILEIDPLWVNFEPRQKDVLQNFPPVATATFVGYKEYAASVTPLLFRWNFQSYAHQRFTPWAQAGAGLLWTSHPFPQGGGPLVPHSKTSRINFTPQVGAGESFHIRHNASIDLGARFIFVGSAGIGEFDPGVDSLQFTLGYSWWRK